MSTDPGSTDPGSADPGSADPGSADPGSNKHAQAEVRTEPERDTSQASIGEMPTGSAVAMADYPTDFGTGMA